MYNFHKYRDFLCFPLSCFYFSFFLFANKEYHWIGQMRWRTCYKKIKKIDKEQIHFCLKKAKVTIGVKVC